MTPNLSPVSRTNQSSPDWPTLPRIKIWLLTSSKGKEISVFLKALWLEAVWPEAGETEFAPGIETLMKRTVVKAIRWSRDSIDNLL
jgi:hypothetical protein